MAEQKTFVPGSSVKRRDFTNGGHILKLSFKMEAFIEFAKQHVNERGYLNLEISERREVGQFGDTHSVTLDTFKPTPRGEEDQTRQQERRPQPQPQSRPENRHPSSGSQERW